MSVIVKGLDMPPKCAYCPMCHGCEEHKHFCSAVEEAEDLTDIFTEGRPTFCPLVEVKKKSVRRKDNV